MLLSRRSDAMLNQLLMQVQRRWKLYVVVLLIVFGINYIPLPYYVEMPGSIEPLDERVNVQGQPQPHKDQGELMFTTVYSMDANPYVWLYGKLAPHAKIIPEKKKL